MWADTSLYTENVIVKGAGGESERLRLLLHRRDDLRMAMPLFFPPRNVRR